MQAGNLVHTFLRAPPQRASAEVCFLLTFDLHGCRLLVNWRELEQQTANVRVARDPTRTGKTGLEREAHPYSIDRLTRWLYNCPI
jgi:hypothetical protein